MTVTLRVLDHGVSMGEHEKRGDDRAWLVEQRYRAVLEVLDGSPVSEVAVRYGLREASRRPAVAGHGPIAAVFDKPATTRS